MELPARSALSLQVYLQYVMDNNAGIYLPREVIPASAASGELTVDEERKFRVYGCQLIQEGSILLKLP